MRIVVVASLVTLLGAAAGVSAQNRTPPRDLLAASTLDFGLDLYRVAKSKPENVLLSPYSITTALAMLRSGAAGETARQIDRALRYPRALPEPAHQSLRRSLRPRKEGAYRLKAANAVWLAEDLVRVSKQFLDRLDKWFGAPAERVDFRDAPEVLARINGWVEKKTLGLIKDIVPARAIRPDTRLCLANAIYFKASWDQPFTESESRERPFRVTGGKNVTARFMHRTSRFGYAENAEAQILELPYIKAETSMIVVLPRKRGGLKALEKTLTAAKLRDWLDALGRKQTKVSLPCFRFGWSAELSSSLATLGMSDAFGGQADLTRITRSEPLAVSNALHKARIEVNEKGTEAAAATAVIFLPLGGAPRTVATFTADHPFLFLIRHRRTGTILFLGCVEDPTKE